MPLLRGAVTFSRFRLEPVDELPRDLRKHLTHALRTRAFAPVDPKGDEDKASGFVECEAPERAEFEPGDVFRGEHALFAWRVEKLRVPGSQLKAEMERWAQAFEKEHKRKPGRTEKAEAKENARRVLRSKTLPSISVLDVSWNTREHRVLIWGAARKAIEEVQEAVENALKVRLVPLVPAAEAARRELADSRLLPTAELFGDELGEVSHG